MVSSPVIFENAERFESSYSKYFQDNNDNVFLSFVPTIKHNYKKFLYIYGGFLVFVAFLLYKYKASFILSRKYNKNTGLYYKAVDYKKMLICSSIFAVILLGFFIVLMNKHSKVRSFIETDDLYM